MVRWELVRGNPQKSHTPTAVETLLIGGFNQNCPVSILPYDWDDLQ